MSKEIKKPIILGGGLAGLSACYHGNGIIYEQNNNIGGHARSHDFNGFVFDEGIHVLHTKNEYVLQLMNKINAGLQAKKRDARIMSHGSLTRYPFQANTFGLPINIVKDCVLGFVENEFTNFDKVKNYQDWIYYMFGKGIGKYFMIPYSQKFWGLNPDQLTTEWVNVRHPRPTLEEVINGALQDQEKGFGINATFHYPKKGGFGSIAKSLAKNIQDRINLKMRVTSIDTNSKEITFNNKQIISYDKIISTLPLPDLINLIPNAPVEVINATKKLKTNSIYVVNLGISRSNLSDKSWIYYLEKDYCFFRISFPFNFTHNPHSVVPLGHSSISAEISYGNNNNLPKSKDELTELVISDLIKAKILLPDDKIVYKNTYDIKYGYVVFDKERKPNVKIIHDYLKHLNIIPCGRYGMWAYLWSDEAILSGKNTAEKLI